MVGIANSTQIEQVKSLWRIVFQDSNEYLDSYFSNHFSKNNCFVISEGDEVIAALQLIPFTFSTGSKELPAAYIFAVLTAPNERQKGHMRNLFNFVFDVIKNRAYAFTFLIPQEDYLFDVYRKLGFEKAFAVSKQKKSLPINNVSLVEIDLKKSFDFHMNYYSEAIFIHPSFEYYKFIFETIYADGGAVLAYKEGADILALGYVVKKDSDLLLLDFLCPNKYQDKFLGGLRNIYGNEFVNISMHCEESSKQYLGMAKIFDTKSVGYDILQKAYMSLMMND